MPRARASGSSAAKPVSPGVRKVIGDALSAQATPEAVEEILGRALASEIVATAVCEDCGGAMKVRIPDVKKQVDTLVAFIEQAEGRPEQRQPEATTVIIERPPL